MMLYVTHLGDRQVQVEAIVQDRAREKHDEDGEGSILEVRRLYFHRSELDAPADGRVGRWWLEAYCLPICGLDILQIKVNTA